MKLKPIVAATGFAFAHFALVVGFVPVAAILPVGLGALAVSSMAFSLILAARWRIVDRITGGPDKSYMLHRYFGFFALIGTLGHWALASSVGAGVFPALADSAEEVGNIAALGLLTMTGAAMVRAIPYHLWKASHMLMGPVFLLAIYHTFIVAGPLAVGSVAWLVMAGISGLGVVAWLQTLQRKRSLTKLMTVDAITPFEGGVDVTMRSDTELAPFRAGQFATLAQNEAGAEAHPFTIAAGDACTRRFVIRSAGDWTDRFVSSVKVGDALRIGRGEGRFLPHTGAKRPQQLWVAGGVGITPFMAALEQMEPDNGAAVTLIYCIRSRDTAGGLKHVEQHAERLPQVDLIVLSDRRNEGLNPIRLSDVVRDMPTNTKVYLCGPEGLKAMVTQVWETAGMKGRIHSERFDFRGAYGLTDLIYIGKPVIGVIRSLAGRTMGIENASAGS